MARLPNRKQQAIRFLTNGKLANDAYGLYDRVGQIVRRTDKAAKLARASTARKVQPIAREEVLKVFNLRPGKLAGKFRATATGDTVRLFASTRRLPLIAFGGKWGGIRTPGATAEIERGQRVTHAGAFIATIRGLTSIRVRKPKGTRRAPRGPVQILRGPSARDMVTGRRTDAETGAPQGFFGAVPAKRVLARLAEFHVAELRRLYASEASRG